MLLLCQRILMYGHAKLAHFRTLGRYLYVKFARHQSLRIFLLVTKKMAKITRKMRKISQPKKKHQQSTIRFSRSRKRNLREFKSLWRT